MKSRFENECGCDFETLNANQTLAALRVFANNLPLLMTEFVALMALAQKCSASLATCIETAPDSHAAMMACAEYASVTNELNSSFMEVFKMNTSLLGDALRVVGIQSITAPPTTTTKQ